MYEFAYNILLAFKQIAGSLVADLSVWWLLAPILLVWIMTEMYYGEYKKEHVGFSSALSVGISFLWISFVSMRIFFLLGRDPKESPEVLMTAIFSLYAIFIIYTAYTHTFLPSTMDKIASPTLIYFLSAVTLLFSEGLLSIDRYVGSALFISLVGFYLVFFIIKKYFLGFRGEFEQVRSLGKNHEN
ncbi:MAG: hypothetical protein COU46_01060 [Candidatus Niyogibacteria bacterium CG10_big_fil_rev_8_21_14_0_10_42_19]|uniref:Uncharacterized protein n=1 Tax=Candidatus Niyogibacteria bacterium CG10_big_fil_rev_8_21_14_0_10_42_19 TaxID=1974725 RepID=A0A2H0TG34_9BACT|nr:MAG: hypothetical protein COU46_01060 [Candidatus Niyogibacteria bacterium CG10_big_fil_rev_8_21_14_0_10_42_19]